MSCCNITKSFKYIPPGTDPNDRSRDVTITNKAVIKSNLKFIEEDFKKVNYIGLPKHDLCLFDIQPVTEENFDFFFSEAIKSLHLDAVVIFTGISEITTANLLSNYIKKHINVEKEYIHTSQSTFDDTQFYSGIWAIKMKNYVVYHLFHKAFSTEHLILFFVFLDFCENNLVDLVLLVVQSPRDQRLFVLIFL